MKTDLKTKTRIIFSRAMIVATFLSAVITLIPLFSILMYVVSKGVTSLNLDFFIHLPKPVGEAGGGMANAIVGTLILVALSCFWALPVGIFSGIYLAEFGGKTGSAIIRFTADVLTGVPSIVIGVFAYTLVVLPMKSFSAISGAFALGLMLIPTVLRTTEEMVRLVPATLREAALALGISRYKTTLHIVVRTALPGILTGALLAIARIAGETAPLLFTAFGNRFWHQGLSQPIAALPLQIFAYAIAPYDDWHRQAWAGSLVLIVLVISMTLASRFWARSRYSGKS